MNRNLVIPLCMTLLLVGGTSWPPIHGFEPSQQLWLFILAGITIFLTLREGLATLLALTFASAAVLQFWPWLVPVATRAAETIHFASGIFVDITGIPLGTAPDGFRIHGILVSADSAKTASFAILVLFALRSALALVETGLEATLRESITLAPRLFAFAALRWPLWAALMAGISPDLVAHGRSLFCGPLLALSLAPLAFIPFRKVHILRHSQIKRETISHSHSSNSAYSSDFNVYSAQADISIKHSIRPLVAWLFCAIVLITAREASYHALLPPFASPVRILIDETHSRWESTMASDTILRDPMLAENSYSPWLRELGLLASVSIAIRPDSSNYSAELIPSNIGIKTAFSGFSRFDLVVLKCPTSPYDASETIELTEFARSGGTILLIGEHTDVFFINTYLNALMKEAGVRISSDGVCDSIGRWLVTGGPLHTSLPWAPGPGLYMWATGASIDGDMRMMPLVVSSPDTFSDPWEPRNHNFFGNLAPDLSHHFGPFVLSAIVPVGAGKLLIHGDSTNFNASMISTPGKRAFTQRLVNTVRVSAQGSVLASVTELLLAVLGCLCCGRLLRAGFRFMPFCALLIQLLFLSGTFAPGFSFGSPSVPDLIIDHSLSPDIGLSYGHQTAVTATDSLVPFLVSCSHAGIVADTSIEPLETVINRVPDPGKNAILLAAPAISPDAQTMRALQKWTRQGGNLLLAFRGQASGPGRAVALAIGLQESALAAAPGSFPALISVESHSIVRPDDKESWTCHPLGSGAVWLIDNVSSGDHADSFRHLAEELCKRMR
ncbi:MAG: hypothetical protein HQM09_09685 [Candidatus Riflebacteria bacterium]|nr:hypothetical protein [Candidatus Riflebacteria bacterium]